MTYIEVLGWADFDQQYTMAVMVSVEYRDIKALRVAFAEINAISEDFQGLPLSKLHQYAEDFIAFLELEGFEKVETTKIYFCD